MSRIIHGFEGLEAGAFRAAVCSVGVFDGVHRGHRQLLYELKVWARSVEGESCVITFTRHPLEVLKGIEVPPILTMENRILELERHGVDAILLADFAEIRDLGPEDFLETVLKGRMGCHRLLVGFDSHIGRDRAGTPANLPEIGRKLGMEVRIASRVLDKDGNKIGSSSIRAAIARGDLVKAANVLGRPVSMRGEVMTGAGRGTRLGIATANLEVTGQVLPPDGVYLVRVFRGADTAPAVANLGVRPTFEKRGSRLLEVHVPGWSGEMYGETLEVRLIRRLRDERRFKSTADLRHQIAEDLKELRRAVADGEI